MADYAINLSGNVCELFIILFFLNGRYSPKYRKGVHIVLCAVFTVFQFLNTSLFLTESPLVILGSLIFSFLVTLLYDIKWLHRAFFAFLFFLINALPEAFIGMTLSLLFDVDVSYSQNTPVIFAACTLTSKFLSYVFVLITKKRRFKLDDNSINRNVYLLYSLPVASIFIMVLFLRCCYIIEDFSFKIIALVTTVVLAFVNIAVFYIIDRMNELFETKEKLLFAEMHINNQTVHYQELYKHQNELRIFRHDIKNRLVSLMAMIKDGNAHQALQTMEKNLNWLDEMNSGIVNSGNPIVDAILQAKLYAAKEKQISIKISTKLAGKIMIDEIELGIMLGNALDNAIEAAEKVTEIENKVINFNLMSTQDRISISISNPIKENIDTRKLLTSKKDKDNHGFGVESIRSITRKYDGIAEFTCEDNIFNANINITNKSYE